MRIVNLNGLALTVADSQPTFWDKVESGRWEPLTLATIRTYCEPGVTFVDCGAWVGPTTLVAAGTGAQVVAIEADPVALEQLAANLAANPELAQRVTVIPRALNPAKGSVSIGSRRKPGSSMSSTLHADAEAHWIAEALTPAELAESISAGCPLFTKIDIEGGEYAVIPALAAYLDRPQSAVLLSLHPKLLEGHSAGEVSRATWQVFSSFAGWTVFRAEGYEWVTVRDPLSPEALAQAIEHATDWLFLKDWELHINAQPAVMATNSSRMRPLSGRSLC
jgi:FkbM family methyltransferase